MTDNKIEWPVWVSSLIRELGLIEETVEFDVIRAPIDPVQNALTGLEDIKIIVTGKIESLETKDS